MEAVSRLATIQAASESLDENSLLRALAQEVQDLRITFSTGFQRRQPKRVRDYPLTLKRLLQGKVFRKELYPLFLENGGDPKSWGQVLKTPASVDELEQLQSWGADDWKDYVIKRGKEASLEVSIRAAKTTRKDLDDQLILAVREMLPPQPWTEGIQKDVADKLGVAEETASKYIDEAIRLGELKREADTQVNPADEA
jgi:hypothetical protein